MVDEDPDEQEQSVERDDEVIKSDVEFDVEDDDGETDDEDDDGTTTVEDARVLSLRSR